MNLISRIQYYVQEMNIHYFTPNFFYNYAKRI